jgi:hypothetical protein
MGKASFNKCPSMFNLVVFILLLVVEGSDFKYGFVELSVGSKIKDVLVDSALAPKSNGYWLES